MDGHGETSIPPYNFVAGGIIRLLSFPLFHSPTMASYISNQMPIKYITLGTIKHDIKRNITRSIYGILLQMLNLTN